MRSLQVEQLEQRNTPAVTAGYANGVLTIYGDGLPNTIRVVDDLNDGTIQVLSNNVLIPIGGVAPTEANTVLVRVFAGGGSDNVQMDASVDLMAPNGNILFVGGSGDDVLIASNDRAELHGQEGNDFLAGGSGNDKLFGGTGNDTLQGGAGDDQLFGQADHDSLHGGDGFDYLEGGDGDDNLDAGGPGEVVDGGSGDDWAADYGDFGSYAGVENQLP
jgi:Ca2+-binding RTX toxin-like protein